MTADAPKRSGKQPAAKARASFPRAARLLKHSDFDRVYKQGRRHFSAHMTVFYLRQERRFTGEKRPRRLHRRPCAGWRGRAEPDQAAAARSSAAAAFGAARRVFRRRGDQSEEVGVDREFSVVLEEVGRALDVIAKKLMEKSHGERELKK